MGGPIPINSCSTTDTLADLAELRETLVAEHRQRHGRSDDLLVGLQLTHSGRFARPNDKDRLEPILSIIIPCSIASSACRPICRC